MHTCAIVNPMSVPAEKVEINPVTGRQRTFPSPQPRAIQDESIILKALDMLAHGSSLRKAAKALGVDDVTLLRVIMENHSGAYAHAKVVRAHRNVDKLEQINRQVLGGSLNPKAAAVASTNLQWISERMDRNTWGKQPDSSGMNITVQVMSLQQVAELEKK